MGLPPSHCVEKHDLPEKLWADLRGHRSESQDLLVWRRIWLSGALGRGGRPGPAPGVGGWGEHHRREGIGVAEGAVCLGWPGRGTSSPLRLAPSDHPRALHEPAAALAMFAPTHPRAGEVRFR